MVSSVCAPRPRAPRVGASVRPRAPGSRRLRSSASWAVQTIHVFEHADEHDRAEDGERAQRGDDGQHEDRARALRIARRWQQPHAARLRRRRRFRASAAIISPMSKDQSRHHFLFGSSCCAARSPINAAAAKYSDLIRSSPAATAGGRGFRQPRGYRAGPFHPGVGVGDLRVALPPAPAPRRLGRRALDRGERTRRFISVDPDEFVVDQPKHRAGFPWLPLGEEDQLADRFAALRRESGRRRKTRQIDRAAPRGRHASRWRATSRGDR